MDWKRVLAKKKKFVLKRSTSPSTGSDLKSHLEIVFCYFSGYSCNISFFFTWFKYSNISATESHQPVNLFSSLQELSGFNSLNRLSHLCLIRISKLHFRSKSRKQFCLR